MLLPRQFQTVPANTVTLGPHACVSLHVPSPHRRMRAAESSILAGAARRLVTAARTTTETSNTFDEQNENSVINMAYHIAIVFAFTIFFF